MSRAFIDVMRAYGAPLTRESYLNLAYAGNPPVDSDGDLDPELEAELPEEFRRKETVTHEEMKAAEDAERAMVNAVIKGLESSAEGGSMSSRGCSDRPH